MEVCSICQNDLDKDIGASTSCGHCFHTECFKLYEVSLSTRNPPTKDKPCPICHISVEKFIPLFLNAGASVDRERKKLEKIVGKQKLKLESKSVKLKNLETTMLHCKMKIENYEEDLKKSHKVIRDQKLEISSNNALMKHFDKKLYETKKSTEEFQNDLVNSRKITKSAKDNLVEAKRKTSYAHYVANELEKKVTFLEEKIKHLQKEIALCEREKKQQSLAHLDVEDSLVKQIHDLNYALVEKTNNLAQHNLPTSRPDRQFGARRKQRLDNPNYDYKNKHIGHCASIEMFTSM